MKKICIFFILICCFPAFGSADIYEWTDENGIRHYSNYAPPQAAVVLVVNRELKFDELADKKQIEAERQEYRRAVWQEITEMQIELLEKQQAVERQIEEANQRAEQTIQTAEVLFHEAKANSKKPTKREYLYYGYAPYPRHHYKNNLKHRHRRKRFSGHEMKQVLKKTHYNHGLKKGIRTNRLTPFKNHRKFSKPPHSAIVRRPK